MDGRKEAGYLTERPELEDGVVEGGLPLQQNASQFEDHRQTHRHRQCPAAHLFGNGRLGLDGHFGFAAGELRHLDGIGGVSCRAGGLHPGDGAVQGEPDLFAVEPPHEHVAAAIEQLSVRAGNSAGRSEGGWQIGECGGWGGTHVYI